MGRIRPQWVSAILQFYLEKYFRFLRGIGPMLDLNGPSNFGPLEIRFWTQMFTTSFIFSA